MIDIETVIQIFGSVHLNVVGIVWYVQIQTVQVDNINMVDNNVISRRFSLKKPFPSLF